MNFQWDMYLTKFDAFRGYKHEFSVGYVFDKLLSSVNILKVTSEIAAPLHPKRTVSWL